MKENIRIMAISDIHFGAFLEPFDLYTELKEFVKRAEIYKPHLIVICGDLFDKKLFANSDDIKYCNKFIADLMSIKDKDPNLHIIMIEGTYSHDVNQYKLFEHYVDDRTYIAYTYTSYDICGMRILILPEEYEDKETYYGDILSNEYDFVFGHGMFSHVGFMTNSNIVHKKKSIVFNYKDFPNVNGYIVFGHIHISEQYKNVIYIGSYSRSRFGEEQPKGHWEFEYDIDKKKATKKIFVENMGVPTYVYVYAENIPFTDNVEDTLLFLKEQSEKYTFIKVVIDTPIPADLENNILGFIKNSSNVSLTKKKVKTSTSKEEILNDRYKQNAERLAKYKGMNFYEVTKVLAKDEYNSLVTTEEINKIINDL